MLVHVCIVYKGFEFVQISKPGRVYKPGCKPDLVNARFPNQVGFQAGLFTRQGFPHSSRNKFMNLQLQWMYLPGSCSVTSDHCSPNLHLDLLLGIQLPKLQFCCGYPFHCLFHKVADFHSHHHSRHGIKECFIGIVLLPAPTHSTGRKTAAGIVHAQ